jgi:hypothetical protein
MKKNIFYGTAFIIGLLLYFSFSWLKSPPIYGIKKNISYIKITQQYNPEPISMQTIFSEDHSWTATLSAQRKITVLATGDVMLGRHVNMIATNSNNFLWSFEKVKDTLKSADITFVNLENPIISNCPLSDSGFVFCGDIKNIDGLLSAGIDVASLANNHAGNYGYDGLVESAALLRKNGILPVGQKTIEYKKVKNKTIAFLGYNDIGYDQQGIAWAYDEAIIKDIKEAISYATAIREIDSRSGVQSTMCWNMLKHRPVAYQGAFGKIKFSHMRSIG